MTKITAVLLTVILQLDILDYLTTVHFSIPTQTTTEQTIQDADDVQKGSDETNLSLQRSRNIKDGRLRVILCQQNGLTAPVLHPFHDRPLTNRVNVIRQETCPLRTLFCVFRI